MKENKFVILGAGRSGINAAKMLLELDKEIVIYDGNGNLDTAAVKEKIGTKKDVKFILGALKEEDVQGYEICVVSPGVPVDSDVCKTAQNTGLTLWSEIELAFRADKNTVLAITGTNGKTTTTTLTYEIMKTVNDRSMVVGNIEIPYTGLALESCGKDCFTVAEISSFQLETLVSFKPHVSAILNITPDHLDRHKTMQRYIELKESIAKNQTEEDFCVLNYEDEVLRTFGEKELKKCKAVFFSSKHELENGFYIKDDEIIISKNGEKTVFLPVSEINLVGVHNYENVMASAAIAYHAGAPLDNIRRAVRTFKAVEHRMEFTTEKNGVKYYNDSKGTNPDAAIKAIDAMPSQTVLIAGGYDKHADFSEWISHVKDKCKLLILMGQTKEKIAAECDKAGFTKYVFVNDMQEAVEKAYQTAESGENVLLSPACASWGMFKCYQDRGNLFKELARKL